MKYPDRNGQQAQDSEPYSRLCADHDEFGNRCANVGTLTESVRGSDRWYCHRHFGPFLGFNYADDDAKPAEYVSGSDLFEKRGDGRDWAREILALAEAGKYHTIYGIQSAREVLGVPKDP